MQTLGDILNNIFFHSIIKCEICGESIWSPDVYELITSEIGLRLCNHCYNNEVNKLEMKDGYDELIQCEDCDMFMTDDEVQYIDDHENGYTSIICEGCKEGRQIYSDRY